MQVHSWRQVLQQGNSGQVHKYVQNVYKYMHIWQTEPSDRTQGASDSPKDLDRKINSKPPKMKIFSVAVAVALVFTFIWIEESSAVPVTEVQELKELMINGNPDASHEEMSVDSWMMPYVRKKRAIECEFCCNCCQRVFCGFCCRF
uniref:Hepcidin-like n=1 Tax=Mastacembelus armatus TaxID=205130 RepID=A0A7N8X8U9_9TELE